MLTIQLLINIKFSSVEKYKHVLNWRALVITRISQQTFTILRLLFPALQCLAILNWFRMNSNLTVETRRGKRTELVLFADTATAITKVEDTLTVREWERILPQSFASFLFKMAFRRLCFDFFRSWLPSCYQDSFSQILTSCN